jgi:hypothetical protein
VSPAQRLETWELTSERFARLRSEYSRIAPITPFSKDLKFGAIIACLGLYREVGTVNDELAPLIFDANTGEVVPLKSLKADLVRLGDLVGVRIYSEGSSRLDVRLRFARDLLHPAYSFNQDGTIRELVIFPAIVAKIVELQGVELALVRAWGMNTVFGGFDGSHGYYQTNLWELSNNDALIFSEIEKDGRLAFLGTHDFVAHVTGVSAGDQHRLRREAQDVYQSISNYLDGVSNPSLASLILPYIIGVVLDDLAQPPVYRSPEGGLGRRAFLAELLAELNRGSISPHIPTTLTEFPPQFLKITVLARTSGIERNPLLIRSSVRQLTREIQLKSVRQE